MVRNNNINDKQKFATNKMKPFAKGKRYYKEIIYKIKNIYHSS